MAHSPSGSWSDAQDVERSDPFEDANKSPTTADQLSGNSDESKDRKGKKAERILKLPPEILEQ